MKLDTERVLEEIHYHLDTLRKYLEANDDNEFKDEHAEVLNLCRLIYDRKTEYKEIDIEYPNEVIVVLKSFSGNSDKEIPDKKMRKKKRHELAKNMIEILNKAEKFYSLKAKLEKK